MDKLFTGNDHHDGLGDSSLTDPIPYAGGALKSWNTNSLLIPLALTAGGFGGKSLVSKAVVTVGALVGGKMLDKFMPASEHQEYSQYLRPTGLDSVLTAGAFLFARGIKQNTSPHDRRRLGGWTNLQHVRRSFQSRGERSLVRSNEGGHERPH